MKKYFWQSIIIFLSLVDLLFLAASTHMVATLNYLEIAIELIRLPIWLFLLIYIEQLNNLKTIYPWLLFGAILMYLGNAFNVNDEVLSLEHWGYQITEDLLLSFGMIFFGFGLYKLIRHLSDQNHLISELASKDLLIGLADRRSYFYDLTVERRNKNIDTNCFLAINIDDFDAYVEKYGKHCGDVILIKLAKLVGSIVRKQDRVIRRGGNLFIIELSQSRIKDAQIKAENIRTMMADNYFQYASDQLNVTVSIGLSEYSGEAKQQKSSINLAEKALKLAQNKGQSMIQVSQVKTESST